MKIILDSSAIIEIERRNIDCLELIKALLRNKEEVIISTVTLSEVLTGAYFKMDVKLALGEAKRVLSQFTSVILDQAVAEKIAEYSAYLTAQGRQIEYPDIAIAATFTVTNSDFLLTQNKKHFEIIPEIGSKARTISEFKKIYA